MTTATTTSTSALMGTWNFDPAHTRLGFSARHAMVATVRGSFKDISGVLHLDGENPAQSTAEVTVRTASIDTGQPDRDGHLRSPDFLDVETYPALSFTSTGASVLGDEEFSLRGDLTIRGITRPIQLKISYLGSSVDPFGNTRAGFEGAADISRKDFGLTWNVALETGGFLVGDKVKIIIDVSAVKQAPVDAS